MSISVVVGTTSTAERIEGIQNIRYSHVSPGGPESFSGTIAADPFTRYQNALYADRPLKVYYDGRLVWDGYLLPVETAMLDDGGQVRIEGAGMFERAKRDKGFGPRTWVDTEYGRWTEAYDHNTQFGVSTDGHVMMELGKGDNVEASNDGYLTYWLNAGQSTDQTLYQLNYDVTGYLTGAAWYAKLRSAETPYAAWTDEKTWNNTNPSAASQTEAITADKRALSLQIYSTSDVTGAAARFYIQLDNVAVWVATAAPTVSSAMVDIAVATGLASANSAESGVVGSGLTQLVFDKMSRAEMLKAIAALHSTHVEYGFSEDKFLVRERPSTVLRSRWVVLDGKAPWDIQWDHEERADYVQVVYQRSDVSPPRTAFVDRPTTPTSAIARRHVLDYSSEPHTAAVATNIADQYLLYQAANIARGSCVARGIVESVDGAPVPAATIGASLGGQLSWWVSSKRDARSQAGIYVTRTEYDYNSDACTIQVGVEREFVPILTRSITITPRTPGGAKLPAATQPWSSSYNPATSTRPGYSAASRQTLSWWQAQNNPANAYRPGY